MSDVCYIDLHAHSDCSDGVYSPEELVSRAMSAGLQALAITDHDAVAGVGRAQNIASHDLEIISGVELSAQEGSSDVHILGYLFDLDHQEFLSYLESFRTHRLTRAKEIVKKLNEMGVRLELESVVGLTQDENTSVGRPHIARALVENKHVKSIQDAFNRYLGNRAAAYVPKVSFSVEDAIQIIHKAGGLAVLAHPGSLRRDELIPGFVELGLDGLETIHPEHTETARRYYKQLAAKYGLVTTGGSDYHGPKHGRCDLGGMKVPHGHLADLKRLLT